MWPRRSPTRVSSLPPSNHPGDTGSDRSRSDNLSAFVERPANIRRLVGHMLGASAAAPKIDPQRIGFFINVLLDGKPIPDAGFSSRERGSEITFPDPGGSRRPRLGDAFDWWSRRRFLEFGERPFRSMFSLMVSRFRMLVSHLGNMAIGAGVATDDRPQPSRDRNHSANILRSAL